MSLVFHFYILGLTSWIQTNPSTEGLKFESPSKWNSYEGFNLEQCSYPYVRGSSSSLGTNVTIHGQDYKYSSWHHFHCTQVNWWSSFTCQKRLMASVNGYCHIDSQRGRVPMQVRAGRPGSEGCLGGAGPNWMKMWSSMGPIQVGKLYYSGMGPWGTCHERREDLERHDKVSHYRQHYVDEMELSHTSGPEIVCAHYTNYYILW